MEGRPRAVTGLSDLHSDGQIYGAVSTQRDQGRSQLRARCGAGTAKRVIVEAIVKLGAALDIRVVAEGIETETARGITRALGCSVRLGYLLAAPMGEREFDRFLDEGLILREGWDDRRLLTMLDRDGNDRNL